MSPPPASDSLGAGALLELPDKRDAGGRKKEEGKRGEGGKEEGRRKEGKGKEKGRKKEGRGEREERRCDGRKMEERRHDGGRQWVAPTQSHKPTLVIEY